MTTVRLPRRMSLLGLLLLLVGALSAGLTRPALAASAIDTDIQAHEGLRVTWQQGAYNWLLYPNGNGVVTVLTGGTCAKVGDIRFIIPNTGELVKALWLGKSGTPFCDGQFNDAAWSLRDDLDTLQYERPGVSVGYPRLTALPANVDHRTAVAVMRAKGINVVASAGCSYRYVEGCTSLDQIRKFSLQGLAGFRTACINWLGACDVTISGGTEVGHTKGTISHETGYKIDILPTASVNQYIYNSGHFRFLGIIKTDWQQYQNVNTGHIYVREYPNQSGDHWDITFN